jgi:hypothetical protein
MGESFKEFGLKQESLVVSAKFFKIGGGIDDNFNLENI